MEILKMHSGRDFNTNVPVAVKLVTKDNGYYEVITNVPNERYGYSTKDRDVAMIEYGKQIANIVADSKIDSFGNLA